MSGNVKIESVEALLVLAKAKIQDPKNWCQGALAIDYEGYQSSPRSMRARQFCSMGAIFALVEEPNDISTKALSILYTVTYGVGPAMINDHNAHDVVMRMFDRAIDFAKSSNIPAPLPAWYYLPYSSTLVPPNTVTVTA